MADTKISMVIGNGFSMSFGYKTGLAITNDSQQPLRWDLICPCTGMALIDSFPNLKKIYQANLYEDSFFIFKKVLDIDYCLELGIDSKQVTLESRHFLTIAFSNYSLKQMALFNSDWTWFQWIKLHRDNINGVVSFNYDLLIETVFDRLGKRYYSLGGNYHDYGIPLVKPHGSSDFEMPRHIINFEQKYPLNSFIDLNNTPIERLESNNLLYPRLQAHCIVPHESNLYSNFQWVLPATTWFNEELKGSDYCLFIGISYLECDRVELDFIIDSIPKSCVIVIANPNPPAVFLDKIKDRPVMIWSSLNGPVNGSDIIPLKCLKTGKKLRKCFCKSGLDYQYCDCH